jgi:hypothetical protein
VGDMAGEGEIRGKVGTGSSCGGALSTISLVPTCDHGTHDAGMWVADELEYGRVGLGSYGDVPMHAIS